MPSSANALACLAYCTRLSVVRGIDVQLVSNGSIGKGGDEFGEVGVGILGLDPVFEVCRDVDKNVSVKHFEKRSWGSKSGGKHFGVRETRHVPDDPDHLSVEKCELTSGKDGGSRAVGAVLTIDPGPVRQR